MKYLSFFHLLLICQLVFTQNNGKIVVVNDIPTNLTENNWKLKIPENDIDTVFEIDSANAILRYGQYLGKAGILVIKSISESAVVKYKIERLKYGDGYSLVFVDGEQIPYEEMNDINPANVEYFQILKKLTEIDLKKHGPQAINGIVLIKMKKAMNNRDD